MKRSTAWHIALALFVLALSAALAARASDPDRWSGWAFGDAQTMLSLRHWNEGGWLANYLLFVPQGYAKVVKHLDEPGLRQHAHGIAPGKGRSVGPRLRYTHYPSGYLVPYAALHRLGLDSLFATRLLSLSFSVGGLWLAYALFRRLTSPPVAFWAAVFYGLSPAFLGYAYSLANQPLDDLFRFGFLLAMALAEDARSARTERFLLGLAWSIEFLLSLSSLDSVFFVYAWLVGWDFLRGRGFRWRRYAVFALAPLAAHGLQFLQNVWYLGLPDAVGDVAGVFGEVALPESRVAVALEALRRIVEAAQWPVIPWLAFVAAYLWAKTWPETVGHDRWPAVRLLSLLASCGILYVLVFPARAGMPYQGRQFLPAVAFLVGDGLVEAARAVRRAWAAWTPGAPLYTRAAALFPPLALWAAALAVGIPFAVADRRTHSFAEPREAALAQALGRFLTVDEPVFFSLNGFRTLFKDNYSEGRPQIDPVLEFYAARRSVLCATSPEMLARDLFELLRRSSERFSPVLVSREPDSLVRAALFLVELKRLNAVPPVCRAEASLFSGYDVMDLTPALRWN